MDLKRNSQTRTFDVRTVLSLVASVYNVPQWMRTTCGEELAGVRPLVMATEAWLDRSCSRPINRVKTHDLDTLARVVSRSVCVTRLVSASPGERKHLLVTHQIYCPQKEVKQTRFEGSVMLPNLQEYGHLLGREGWRVKTKYATHPDVYIRRQDLTVTVTADTQATVDLVVRDLQDTLRHFANRRQATVDAVANDVTATLRRFSQGGADSASDLVVHARQHQAEDWHELQQALLEASVEQQRAAGGADEWDELQRAMWEASVEWRSAVE